MTDAPIEIAKAREAAPPPRRAWHVDPRLRRLGSGLVGATFWLLFAYANIHSSIESHRVIGLGVGILGVWASVLFIVRRQPVQVSRSLPVWAIAYAGTFGASLLRPGGGESGWSDAVGLCVQCLAVGLGAFGYLALGLGFFSLAGGLDWPDPAWARLAIGALCFGGLAGIAAFFVPAGIGAREGAIAWFLAPTVGMESALMLAVMARLWITVGELMVVATGLAWLQRHPRAVPTP